MARTWNSINARFAGWMARRMRVCSVCRRLHRDEHTHRMLSTSNSLADQELDVLGQAERWAFLAEVDW